jgi:glyoxylase-like metal-dependent hydrolase (beta-lactamase superfamily II)
MMKSQNTWFTIDRLDEDSFILSEYRHWEETHCYLLCGTQRSLLIDTGLGICNISEEVNKLTDKPVTAVATHIHWDHIGGHRYYPDFYAHEEELSWLQGGFPLSMETIRGMVVDRCDLPEGYDVSAYEFFQGTPTRILMGCEAIDLGGRIIEVLHTPGHSPGHMCFWEAPRGYLFTGDLVYKDTLFAYYPSTDPQAYLASLSKVAALPVRRVLPAHHTLDIQPEILIRMRNAFRKLNDDGKLHHGSGTFDYGDWAVWL